MGSTRRLVPTRTLGGASRKSIIAGGSGSGLDGDSGRPAASLQQRAGAAAAAAETAYKLIDLGTAVGRGDEGDEAGGAESSLMTITDMEVLMLRARTNSGVGPAAVLPDLYTS